MNLADIGLMLLGGVLVVHAPFFAMVASVVCFVLYWRATACKHDY